MRKKSYKFRSFLAFNYVCKLCLIFNRYSPEIRFNDELIQYSIVIDAGGSGIVTLSFMSELFHSLDKANIRYDMFVTSRSTNCQIIVTLYPDESE